VDSGADYCLFPAFVASEIGVDFKQGKRCSFMGAEGGSQEARFFEKFQITFDRANGLFVLDAGK